MVRIQSSMPDITYIDQYIEDGNRAIVSLQNLYDSKKIETAEKDHIFKVPWNDFFLKYRKELDDITEWQSIPESNFYKPKMVSLELYGTTELWVGLLRVNNMKNVSEFHYPIIKVYTPQFLMELINIYFKREKKIT